MVGTCLVFFVDNQLAKLRLIRGDIGTDSGTLHAGFELEASLSYIRRVHSDYLRQASVEGFFGKIAEVGPGDNCGVALLALADGAATVDLVDRFYSARDPEKHAAIYEALIEEAPTLHQFKGLKREEDFQGVFRRYGEKASAEQFFLDNGGYDFIISRAVLEHVTNPVLALKRMALALNPGGRMIHVVDLRDHGLFTKYDFPELTFLTVPSRLYREMISATGRPNRVPLSAYRTALPEASIKVTSLVGVGHLQTPTRFEDIPAGLLSRAVSQVRSQRPRFDKTYTTESEDDLAVSGFLLFFRRAPQQQRTDST
jgi:SAM-dependent methyltransferase